MKKILMALLVGHSAVAYAGGTAVGLAGDGTATAAWVVGPRLGTTGRIQASVYEVR